MSTNKKLDEGSEKVKLAEKSLKTSFLKWRPDYEVAADEYSQAATCFKNARSLEKSKDCYLKAANCHMHNNSLFHAAKCIDQAILLAKELNNHKDIAQLAEKACDLYRQHGSPESAAASLDKAGKILEHNEPEQAVRLYKKAADIVKSEDSYKQAAEFWNNIGRIYVRLKMYDEAASAIQQEIVLHMETDCIFEVGRLTVAVILVHLARGDFVAAEKAFKEWGNCCDQTEIKNLEMLFEGIDNEDNEVIKKALNQPFIKHMDVEYSRLARELPILENDGSVKYNVTSNSTSDSKEEWDKTGGKPSCHDEEEEEEGLC